MPHPGLAAAARFRQRMWTQSACPPAAHRPRRAGSRRCQTRGGGSDGDRLREIDGVAPPRVPFLYPERLLRARQRRGAGRYATGSKAPRIPRECWPEVAARAKREGLRSVARDLGVSHETVRTVLRAVSPADHAA